MIFVKIREKIEEKAFSVQLKQGIKEPSTFDAMEEKFSVREIIGIINQVESEYNNDIVYQLAMKYALCLTQYGVDITEKLETATQNAMALEKAYIRGRQDECDRFSEWRYRHNNGWIPCGKEQPSKDGYYLILTSYGEIDVREYDYGNGWGWDGFERITHWKPLPQPPKGE